MLGLRFCARAFSSCGKQGPLFIAVHGPLTIVASLVAEHRLQTRRLSSCGSQAQLLRGMWDLPRPGLEPVSPALAGRFSTTASPGKPHITNLYQIHSLKFVGSPRQYALGCNLCESSLEPQLLGDRFYCFSFSLLLHQASRRPSLNSPRHGFISGSYSYQFPMLPWTIPFDSSSPCDYTQERTADC